MGSATGEAEAADEQRSSGSAFVTILELKEPCQPSEGEVGQGDWSECTQNLRMSPWINVFDSLTVSSNAHTSMTSTNFWVRCTENVMFLIVRGVYISGSSWLCKIVAMNAAFNPSPLLSACGLPTKLLLMVSLSIYARILTH